MLPFSVRYRGRNGLPVTLFHPRHLLAKQWSFVLGRVVRSDLRRRLQSSASSRRQRETIPATAPARQAAAIYRPTLGRFHSRHSATRRKTKQAVPPRNALPWETSPLCAPPPDRSHRRGQPSRKYRIAESTAPEPGTSRARCSPDACDRPRQHSNKRMNPKLERLLSSRHRE